MSIVQGKTGRIGFCEDFLGLTDDDNVTVSDTVPTRWNNVAIAAISGAVDQNVVVDEGNGVISLSGAGAAGDGAAIFSAPMAPDVNGPLRMAARFKTSSASDFQAYVGFQETVDRDEPVRAFELSGTTLTDNNVGQAIGIYFDSAADTDDWRAAGSNDGTIFSATSSPGIRANTTLEADSWIVVEVEVEPDGSARVWMGDNNLGKMTLIDDDGDGFTLPKGNLDESAFLHPILLFMAESTGDPTLEVDYFEVSASRDWETE